MTENTARSRERALLLRKRLKQKKPKFVRPESWRYVRLKKRWRRPRGLDHKVRLKRKGWPPSVETGYRGPRAARGLHPSGYFEVLVHNSGELFRIDPKTQAARIAHSVGKRKRVQLLNEAKKRKIVILNFKVAKRAVQEETDIAEEEKPERSKETSEKEQAKKPRQKKRRVRKPKKEAEAQ